LNTFVIEKFKSRLVQTFAIKNSTVKKNFFALGLLQVTNYLVPLITIPYISRIFGPEIFGLINFATSFIAYFWLLVNYGFDLSASRDIAQNKNNKVKINEIFNNVLFSKLFLYLIALIIFLIILFSVDKINQQKSIYLLLFFGGIFNIFFPTWFFQGIEKLTFSSFLNFITKLLFTILIFSIIKSKEDYIIYPLTLIIGQFFVAILSIYIILKKFDIKIKLVPFNTILITLKKSWQIFATTVVINLYTTTNIVLLGFLSTDYDVGIFTAAYKIVAVFISIITIPIGQAIYPNIAYSFSKSSEEGIRKIIKALKFVLPITLFSSFLLLVFSNFFINILFGPKFGEANKAIRILSFLPFIIGLSNLFGIQGLLNLKRDRYVYLITTFGALIGLILNLWLIPILRFNGTAISWMITEIFITIMMFVFFIRNSKFLFVLKNEFLLIQGQNNV
jgi:PST family polysaccharide transporter